MPSSCTGSQGTGAACPIPTISASCSLPRSSGPSQTPWQAKKEFFAFFTEQRGILAKQRQQMYMALKELNLGLEERMDTKVGVLSGGQRQALSLLMATYAKPQLLLLDEHTAALDPQTASKVLELTAKIVKKYHMTTLMVTHNMQDALTYGQKIMIMKEGQIIDVIDRERKKDLTVEQLIHLYSSKTHDYNDRILL